MYLCRSKQVYLKQLLMGLRIKEVCREKKISLAEVAQHIGISPISLSQSLNGNPTLGRLNEVATILGVDVGELFDKDSCADDIHGCLYVNGKAVLVKSRKDIENLLGELD